MPRIAILGGGLCGRLTALQLAEQGLSVALFDKGGRKGENAAAYVAAAMLAPAAEAVEATPKVIKLGRQNIPLWRNIRGRLKTPTMMQENGSLIVWHGQDKPLSNEFVRQFLALVEAAMQPPFLAQRHGQHEIEMLRFQPIGRIAAHQFRQRTAHAEVGQMLQRAYHTADGRLIIQRSPHPLKCRRLLLTAAAHRPALYSAETQGATVCHVRKKLFQVRRAAVAKTAIRPGFAR